MGFWIGFANEAVWEPSLSVGELFISQIRQLEQIINLESGIISESSDMLDIQRKDFKIFLSSLIDCYKSINNEVLKSQIISSIAIMLEISKRIELDIKDFSPPVEIISLSNTLSKHMP